MCLKSMGVDYRTNVLPRTHVHTHTHTRIHTQLSSIKKDIVWDFLGVSVVKNLPANAVDTGLIPDPGRSHLP